jgi:hypothetical protein
LTQGSAQTEHSVLPDVKPWPLHIGQTVSLYNIYLLTSVKLFTTARAMLNMALPNLLPAAILNNRKLFIKKLTS